MNKRAAYLIRLKKQNERKYYRSIFLALRRTKSPVLRALRERGIAAAMVQAQAMQPDYMVTAIRKIWEELAPVEAEREYRYMMRNRKGLGIFSFDWLSDIATFFDRVVLNQIRINMMDVTMNRVMRVLQGGLLQGESIPEMVSRLEDTELDKNRARLIVRTEINRAMNYGHSVAVSRLPFTVNKVWVSAKDWRVRGAMPDERADHRAMNGQKVRQDEPFTDPRSGAKMMFPGDSSLGASAADVCNCRCVVVHEEG